MSLIRKPASEERIQQMPSHTDRIMMQGCNCTFKGQQEKQAVTECSFQRVTTPTLKLKLVQYQNEWGFGEVLAQTCLRPGNHRDGPGDCRCNYGFMSRFYGSDHFTCNVWITKNQWHIKTHNNQKNTVQSATRTSSVTTHEPQREWLMKHSVSCQLTWSTHLVSIWH